MSKCDIKRGTTMKSMINLSTAGEVLKEECRVYHAGYEECEVSYGFGPFVRDHYLIHFVVSGKGKFTCNDQEWDLKTGETFLITPGVRTYYEADANEPWTYYWIGFHGKEARELIKRLGYAVNKPTRTFDPESTVPQLKHIISCENRSYEEHLKLRGLLFILLSHMMEQNNDDLAISDYKRDYVEEVKEYIEMNYSRQIRIDQIASHIGIDRSYLTRLFQKYEGCSPKEFLLEYRLFKAKYLLEQFHSVGDVARSVGYSDAYAFSKAFSRGVGCSPRYYQKQTREE